ncbi:unnamed protein product [Parajaminaea phylloscopi]
MSSGGDSRRRAEIEAKRAKLAELKRAREERSSRLQAGRPAPYGSQTGTPASTSSSSRKDIDDLVATLVGSTSSPANRTPKSSAGTLSAHDEASHYASPRKAPPRTSSDFDGSESIAPSFNLATRGETGQQGGFGDAGSSIGFRGVPDMVDVSTELFEFPQREKVYYTKEVQTATDSNGYGEQGIGAGDRDGLSGGHSGVSVGAESRSDITPVTEAVIRKKILDEQAEALEKDRQMKREEEELERQIEEELRVMSPEEVATIFGTQDFSDFVESSSKIVERALTDSYDYMKDYSIAGAGSASDGTKDEVKLARCFWDEKLCRGRSITSIDWSPKHPELVAVSYSRTNIVADLSPDGLVLIWNMHLSDRPEFVFQAQTDVLSVCFSPFHPHLVVGGTYSGQILIWDTRTKIRTGGAGALPSLKTPLSAITGHTHPVYSLNIVGTQNANHLITTSTDGLVCSWMLPDMLARPVDSLQLLNQAHPKTDEVSVTSVGFLQQGRVETNAFWIGTEDGSVWMASRYDRAGAKAGLQPGGGAIGGHAAPVTSLDFHRAGTGAAASQHSVSGVDFSDLVLTSSMDWTAKLWRVSSATVPNTSASSSGATRAGASMAGSGMPASASSTSLSASVAATAHQQNKPMTLLFTFDDYSDYVLCAQWHPTHPCLFATCDAAGTVHIHNVLQDVERPVAQMRLGIDGSGGVQAGPALATGAAMAGPGPASAAGLNKLAWDKSSDAHRLACGGSDGRLYVLDVGTLSSTTGTGEEWMELGRLVGRATAASTSSTRAGGGFNR